MPADHGESLRRTMPPTVAHEFVGRQWELALLQRELDMAVSGQLRVLGVSGDPGIGKTRLLSQLSQVAIARGMTVLQGGASEAEGMPAYLPFLEALISFVRTADTSRLVECAGGEVAILSTVLPEIAQRLGPSTVPYQLPHDQARLRLFEALTSFLSAIAAPSGLLLILDDIHWGDPSTLDLLIHLARRQPAARILLAVAYRTAEARENPAVHRALI